jgi:hypothetical protein
MYDTPRVTTYVHNPIYGTPPLILPQDEQIDREAEQELIAAASREEAGREAAMLRALNEPQFRVKRIAPAEILRQPHLPHDFAEQITALDEKTFRKGIAIDRDRLLSSGKERFEALLAADHEARQEQKVIGGRIDLSDWRSVYLALCHYGAIAAVPVPQRTTYEQWHGINQELDDVRELSGFVDLWKVFGAQPRAVRAIYRFKDIFDSLVFGQSLLERICDDGRIRSRFFCGGHGERCRFAQSWLNVPHVLSLEGESRAVLFWLMHENGAPPNIIELAREFYQVRCPSEEQTVFIDALFEGYLLGYTDWQLWQHVGRQTRRPPDRVLLNRWHEKLKSRFKRVRQFHADLQYHCFMRQEGNHYQLDAAGYRKFVDHTIEKLRNTLSAIVALTVEKHSPGLLVARFQNALWCTEKPKSPPTISETLNTVFQP